MITTTKGRKVVVKFVGNTQAVKTVLQATATQKG